VGFYNARVVLSDIMVSLYTSRVTLYDSIMSIYGSRVSVYGFSCAFPQDDYLRL
jgi:hypothetical protein